MMRSISQQKCRIVDCNKWAEKNCLVHKLYFCKKHLLEHNYNDHNRDAFFKDKVIKNTLQMNEYLVSIKNSILLNAKTLVSAINSSVSKMFNILKDEKSIAIALINRCGPDLETNELLNCFPSFTSSTDLEICMNSILNFEDNINIVTFTESLSKLEQRLEIDLNENANKKYEISKEIAKFNETVAKYSTPSLKNSRKFCEDYRFEDDLDSNRIIFGRLAITKGQSVYLGQRKWFLHRHGFGISMHNGGLYEGYWEEGKRSGKGVCTWPSGWRYNGDWKFDMLNGEGTFTYSSGDQYIGEFLNNKRSGDGVYTWADGISYNGKWKNGAMCEEGVITNPDGSIFEGERKHLPQ